MAQNSIASPTEPVPERIAEAELFSVISSLLGGYYDISVGRADQCRFMSLTDGGLWA